MAVEKYNEMQEDGALFSWAESVEFAQRAVQANLREQTAEAERLGLEKGIEEGIEKGLEKGKRAVLQTLIIHKYEIDDTWAETLSDEQIEDAVVDLLECDTYDALKDRLKNTKPE